MKYPAHIYAKALVELMADAAESKHEGIARKFVALVEKNGDGMHLKKILEEAARLERGRMGIRKVVLESARPLTPTQKKKLMQFTTKEDVIQERIDPALVAGARIFVDDELEFDGSLGGKLNAIFGNMQ